MKKPTVVAAAMTAIILAVTIGWPLYAFGVEKGLLLFLGTMAVVSILAVLALIVFVALVALIEWRMEQ